MCECFSPQVFFIFSYNSTYYTKTATKIIQRRWIMNWLLNVSFRILNKRIYQSRSQSIQFTTTYISITKDYNYPYGTSSKQISTHSAFILRILFSSENSLVAVTPISSSLVMCFIKPTSIMSDKVDSGVGDSEIPTASLIWNNNNSCSSSGFHDHSQWYCCLNLLVNLCCVIYNHLYSHSWFQ